MPSSFFTDRLQRFADALGDEKTKRRITDYLRQCDFPGPVVTLVGAEGRGKSTLFTKATHLSVEPEDRVNCAGATDWKKTVKNHLKVLGCDLHEVGEDTVGEVLYCDAPPFRTSEQDKKVMSLLAITDLAVMTVQITQPAGAEEVGFVRTHLADIPAVLVLTKCDQADEGDFQEGLDAVLENYGEFPWLAVLLSDWDGNVSEITKGDKVLQSFDAWRQAEGQSSGEQARQAHLNHLQQRWRAQARTFLDAKEQEEAPKLEQVVQTRGDFAAVAEAGRLEDELVNGVDRLPEQALNGYKSQMTDLRRQVEQITHEFTDRIRSGAEVTHAELEKALDAVYAEWDQAARNSERERIKPFLNALEKKALQYVKLIADADHVQASHDISPQTHERNDAFLSYSGHENSVELAGNFDLTLPDKLRFAALPTVSGLGTGVLLLTVVGATFLAPFAPIIALAGAGAMGIGTFGSLTESNHQRRAARVREAIQRQMGQRERRLEQRFYADWKQVRDSLRDSVAASKRRLNLLMMQQTPMQDKDLRRQQDALQSNLQKIYGLRQELGWLEEKCQESTLITNTEE